MNRHWLLLLFAGFYLTACSPAAVPAEDGDGDTTALPAPPDTEGGAAAGIDFMARGNEPFWRLALELETEPELQFYWQDEGGDSLRIALPMAQLSPELNTARYEVLLPDGTLRLTILGEGCQDDMSGESLPYSVQVVKDGQTYNGCGEYTEAQPVLKRWQLVSIDGQAVDTAAFPQGVPTLDLAGEAGRVSGLAGCNRYSGPVEVGLSQLVFGPLISTKMACPNLDTENRFLTVLRDTVTYKLLPGYLILLNDGRNLAFTIPRDGRAR